MVIWPAFRMGQLRVNDHPYHAPQFNICRILLIWYFRYYYYIHHGISCDHVAQIEPVWFERMFKLVPPALKTKEYAETIELLKDEIFQDYLISSKQAIVDFVLKK